VKEAEEVVEAEEVEQEEAEAAAEVPGRETTSTLCFPSPTSSSERSMT
jgi:hypothetical protein